MDDELAEVHKLIKLCISQLEDSRKAGGGISLTALTDAQVILSVAAGKLHNYREIEREVELCNPRNIIKFPGT
jgi:hypothetical protein